jgi:hypothetical protein
MANKNHNWRKEQPHLATTGKITTRKFAENNPKKVEWVRVKRTRK